MKDTVSHYVPPHSPLTSTEPQVFSNNLTMPQERWVVLAQDRPQLVGGFAAAPDRVLLGSRQNRDRLGEFAVGGQRAVQVGIDTQDVRQRHRIGVVGLRT